MPIRFDVTDTEQHEPGIAAATRVLRSGDLVVLPTDTVYGLAADAFDARAVRRLLEAKGRGPAMPPPVLVAAPSTLDALGTGLSEWTRRLVERFWPGPLTVIVRQQSSLQWDLGETRGTVAVRMPDDEVALEVLTRTGPLAVSSANLTGEPAATTADEAEEMLAERVSVILDAGPSPRAVPSTIVDCTGDQPRVLRAGAISTDQLREALLDLNVAVDDPAEVSVHPEELPPGFADEDPTDPDGADPAPAGPEADAGPQGAAESSA